MADDYATWRPQAEQNWTDEDVERLRAENARLRQELQHLQEQRVILLSLPEGDRVELAKYKEFRKVRAALRALMAAVEHEDPKVLAEAMRLARALLPDDT